MLSDNERIEFRAILSQFDYEEADFDVLDVADEMEGGSPQQRTIKVVRRDSGIERIYATREGRHWLDELEVDLHEDVFAPSFEE